MTFVTKEILANLNAQGFTTVKKPLVIYHANCADGFSAAWCFHDYDKEGYDFHVGVYGETPPDCTDRVVYLVDFSYKREVVKEICVTAAVVWLIDHHKTAIEDLKGLEWEETNFFAYTDNDRSGAMLAWDFLHNINSPKGYKAHKPPPALLAHVQDRDLWKFKLAGTREISAAIFSYEYTFENWDMLMASDAEGLAALVSGGQAIERKHHKDIKELLVVTKRLMVIGGHTVPVASLPYVFSSDAGHLMAEEFFTGIVFAACYWDTATDRIFSLRSTEGGLDVSAVAKEYGGGGHEHAAGFKVPRNHILATS